MKEPSIIALAGGIGAGKTVVSTELALQLHWKRTSFGDYIRALAESKGLPAERKILQSVGESLVSQNLEGFVRLVLDHVNWVPGEPIVVDGIRHIEVLHHLCLLVDPQKPVLIYLDIASGERLTRALKRDGETLSALERAEEHSTEIQVKNMLREAATLVVSANIPVAEIVDCIIRKLGLVPS